MKIRSGFVSNSSSSSFVVKAREAKYKPSKENPGCQKFDKWISKLTKTQVNKLKQNGFRMTWAHSPSQVPATRKEKDEHEAQVIKNPDFDYSWGYDVTCNQDKVFQFLIENDIPFSAEEHYGHRHVFFDGKTVTTAVNFGVIMSMYGVSEKMNVSNPVQTFTKKQYLKKVSW